MCLIEAHRVYACMRERVTDTQSQLASTTQVSSKPVTQWILGGAERDAISCPCIEQHTHIQQQQSINRPCSTTLMCCHAAREGQCETSGRLLDGSAGLGRTAPCSLEGRTQSWDTESMGKNRMLGYRVHGQNRMLGYKSPWAEQDAGI